MTEVDATRACSPVRPRWPPASYAVQVRAAAEPQKITPALIEAAKKEGKLSWYTSVDLPVAEKIAKAFEAAYPGVGMKVERSGAERIFQRIGQEYQSKIYNCDVVNSSDAAHLIIWKRASLLASFLPEEVAKYFPKEHWDPDGMYASWRVTLSPDRLQHQPGESRRTRPRASWIFWRPSGRARSSRRIRATAAPS